MCILWAVVHKGRTYLLGIQDDKMGCALMREVRSSHQQSNCCFHIPDRLLKVRLAVRFCRFDCMALVNPRAHSETIATDEAPSLNRSMAKAQLFILPRISRCFAVTCGF